MTLGRDDFDAFFTALHDGQKPFTWQRRLLDTVLDDGWPDALVAPTGSGKTAAIDVHVFALAVAAATGSSLPPRRLAMIVGRRVLVDDQYRHALTIAERLAEPTASPIVAEVAEVLWQLQADIRSPHDDSDSPRSPLLVARLRGGLPPSRRWTDHPTAAAVLCATPDMWAAGCCSAAMARRRAPGRGRPGSSPSTPSPSSTRPISRGNSFAPRAA
jgi:CRISPR-associated endonuclease/helicase Cas3